MADSFYNPALAQFLLGTTPLLTADIRAQLVSAEYVFNPDTSFLTSVPVSARVGDPVALSGRDVTNETFIASPTVIPLVPASEPVATAALILMWTGADASSRLICYRDSGIGLPATPTNGNITLTWTGGVFRLRRQ